MLKIMKILKSLSSAALAAIMLAACAGGNSSDTLAAAARLADSIAAADANGTVAAAAPDLQASFTIDDPQIAISSVGQELFDVFASQQLKKIPTPDIAAVCTALRESKGSFITILNSPAGESVTFSLTPQQIIKLQRAKNSELNLGAARNQVVAVAEHMIPAPDAHSGALRVDVAVSKSFLEYNIVWPKASAFARDSQGVLTQRYFNPLKEQYQAMGPLAEPVISMLQTLGIDGVRIVYTAPDSDRRLQQAFPWREIRLPIENK